MNHRVIQFAVLSTLFHGIFLFCLLRFSTPSQQHRVQNKPIKSYLIFEKSIPNPEPIIKPSEVLGKGMVQAQNAQIQAHAPPEPDKLITTPVEKSSTDVAEVTSADTTAPMSSHKIQTAVSQYMQNLYARELGKLSEESFNERQKPQPLIDKSRPLSKNQKLKNLSTTFAPKGSGIIVLSEFGPKEKTIMLGDSCFTVTQTAVDDKVWKGSSRWTRSDTCQKYNKYDGQLQKSLNKYLKK